MSLASPRISTAGVGSSLAASGDLDVEAVKPEHLPENNEPKTSFTVSIETVVVTALLFFSILAWFEFLRGLYEDVLIDHTEDEVKINVAHRFWYAAFVTALSIIIIYTIYKVSLHNNYK